MDTNLNRRKFLKHGFIGATGFIAALTAPVSLNLSQGFKLDHGKLPVNLGIAEAQAACGSSYNCSGGGGQCGSSYNCSGGGGQCGSSYNCSGGGGQCGSSYNCAGS